MEHKEKPAEKKSNPSGNKFSQIRNPKNRREVGEKKTN